MPILSGWDRHCHQNGTRNHCLHLWCRDSSSWLLAWLLPYSVLHWRVHGRTPQLPQLQSIPGSLSAVDSFWLFGRHFLCMFEVFPPVNIHIVVFCYVGTHLPDLCSVSHPEGHNMNFLCSLSVFKSTSALCSKNSMVPEGLLILLFVGWNTAFYTTFSNSHWSSKLLKLHKCPSLSHDIYKAWDFEVLIVLSMKVVVLWDMWCHLHVRRTQQVRLKCW